jgi:hypothetical protein
MGLMNSLVTVELLSEKLLPAFSVIKLSYFTDEPLNTNHSAYTWPCILRIFLDTQKSCCLHFVNSVVIICILEPTVHVVS